MVANSEFVLDVTSWRRCAYHLASACSHDVGLIAAGDIYMFGVFLGKSMLEIGELFPAASAHDGEVVEEYLSWDERNPVSIRSSLRWGRENARTIREVISLEMWETLNDLWHFLRRGPGRRRYRQDRDAFYKRVKDGCDLFLALSESTLLGIVAYAFAEAAYKAGLSVLATLSFPPDANDFTTQHNELLRMRPQLASAETERQYLATRVNALTHERDTCMQGLAQSARRVDVLRARVLAICRRIER